MTEFNVEEQDKQEDNTERNKTEQQQKQTKERALVQSSY